MTQWWLAPPAGNFIEIRDIAHHPESQHSGSAARSWEAGRQTLVAMVRRWNELVIPARSLAGRQPQDEAIAVIGHEE
jgi:hypothetical protein